MNEVNQSLEWREVDDVIYANIGEYWSKPLESNGLRVNKLAKHVPRSLYFRREAEVAVLKGSLFTESNRITNNILEYAEAFRTPNGRKLGKPTDDLARVIFDKLKHDDVEAMGLWYIVVMHEPVKDSGGVPGLLGAHRDGGHLLIDAYDGRPGFWWNHWYGFVFEILPQ